MLKIFCLIAALLAATPSFAQSGSVQTQSQINTDINGNWADNGTGAITPHVARQTLLNFNATMFSPTNIFDSAFCSTGFAILQRGDGASYNGTSTPTSSWNCVTGRPVLQGTPQFYISTGGSDVSGNGSSGSPWATCIHALFIITQQYDFGFTTPTINFANGTYGNSAACFLGYTPVGGDLGGSAINIVGNTGSPSSVVLDGGGSGCGICDQATGVTLNIKGMTLQNWHSAVSIQNPGSTVNITGPVTFGTGNTLDMDIEAGGWLFCNEGTPVTTITATGTSGQFVYAGGGHFDHNGCTIALGTSTFSSTAIYNAENFGTIVLHGSGSLLTGTPTGKAFNIDRGGSIALDNGSGSQLPGSSMLGTTAGQNFGGYFNSNSTPISTFAGIASNLPGGTGQISVGYIIAITDGKASNCGDTSCTTWGTTITAGGGALQLLAWWNGSNWTLIGK